MQQRTEGEVAMLINYTTNKQKSAVQVFPVAEFKQFSTVTVTSACRATRPSTHFVAATQTTG
jgi:hypothetical protein